MPTVLVAESGRAAGSAASRRLRREDKIPGVLYGQGMEPLSVAVERRELRIATSGTAGFNTVLDLTIDGPDGQQVYPAIVKELQRHPVRRTVSHVDFLQVNLDEEIHVSVPLHLVGEAAAVVANNGLVDAAVDSIEIATTPRTIPDEFVIDISAMEMDSVIRLADVPMPAGVTPLGDPEMAVVTVLVMRAPVEEEAEVEGEAAEGEAGEGEAGEGAEAAADSGDTAAE
jgi:large subunit ribosomal protein L25